MFNYAKLLSDFCSILGEYKNDVCCINLFNIINFLYDVKSSITIDNNRYKCIARPLELHIFDNSVINKVLPRHLWNTNNFVIIKLYFNERLNRGRAPFSILSTDEIKELINGLNSFEVEISKGDFYLATWHLDRHLREDNDGQPEFHHPLYHFSFGGERMKNRFNENDESYGKTIIMDSPRFMHPPMEVVLGIDFMFIQFFSINDLPFLKDSRYLKTVNAAKAYFWKSYAIAWAKNYCNNSSIAIGNNALSIDNIFSAQIIGQYER